MRLRYLFFFLLLINFLGLFSQSRPPTPQVKIMGNQIIDYPQQGLVASQTGLVICRIFLDSNQQYMNSKVLYASSEILKEAVTENVSQVQFQLSQPAQHRFHFLVPFVFDLDQGKRNLRSIEDLFADGEACLAHGLYQLSLRYFDPILRKKHTTASQLLQVHKARAHAYCHLNAWVDARAELSNMLAIRRKMNDQLEPSEASLRVQLMLLSMLSGQEKLSLGDIFWLEQHDLHHITYLSHFISQLQLSQNQSLLLAKRSEDMRSIAPKKAKFWLTSMEALAYQRCRNFEASTYFFSQALAMLDKPYEKASVVAERAWGHYLQGQPEIALSLLQEATDLDPNLADALYYQALCLERLSYHEEALESLEQALQLGLHPHKQAQGEVMMTVIASSTNS